MIAYLNLGSRKSALLAQCDFHVRAGLRIPDGIAHDVLDGSTQLFPCARGHARVHEIDFDGATLGLGLEVSIYGNFLDQAAQLKRFRAA